MSDGTKVTLPREVAEAIEYIRDTDLTEHALYDYRWLKSDIDDDCEIRPRKNEILRYIEYKDDIFDDRNQLMTYFSALVNGYTVEQTPEERVRVYYEGLRVTGHGVSGFANVRSKDKMLGVRNTLDILGITINGVNDK
jgi:hypothetical protein